MLLSGKFVVFPFIFAQDCRYVHGIYLTSEPLTPKKHFNNLNIYIYRIYCNKRPPYNKRPSQISAPFDTKIII